MDFILSFFELDTIGANFVKGLVNLIGWAIDILGQLLLSVGDDLVRFAIEINLSLPDNSQVIALGLQTTTLVANLGVVVGLIIIAFATMVRAEWLTTAKEALPKLLTAILLINFTNFLFVDVVIKGSDVVTSNLYKASNYNDDSLRGVFDPDLNLHQLLSARMVASKNADSANYPDAVEHFADYFAIQDEISSAIIQNLEILNNNVAPNETITNAQKNIILQNTMDDINFWIADPKLQEGGSWWNIGKKGLLSRISGLFGASALYDAVRNISDFSNKDWERSNLDSLLYKNLLSGNVNAYADPPLVAFNGVTLTYSPPLAAYQEAIWKAMEGSFMTHVGCNINDKGGAACDPLQWVATKIAEGLNDWEKAIIRMAEVLFQSIWIFIGVLTLFGMASMFFIRYIALSLLVILFPFALLGWIFPKIASAGGGKNIWTSWWGQFMRWILFGPIAMFFIFLSIKTVTLLGAINPYSRSATSPTGSSPLAIIASSIGDMLVIIGLLIGGLYTANKMGIAGSKMFYGSMIKARGWAGKQIKKQALRGTRAGLRKAGHAATAPLRTKTGQKILEGLHGVPVLKHASMAADKLAYRSEKATDAATKRGLPMDDDTRLARMASGLRGTRQVAAIEALIKKGKGASIAGWADIIADERTRSTFQRLNKKSVIDDFEKHMSINGETIRTYRSAYDDEFGRTGDEGAARTFAEHSASGPLSDFRKGLKSEDERRVSTAILGDEFKDSYGMSKQEYESISKMSIKNASEEHGVMLNATAPRLKAGQLAERDNEVRENFNSMASSFATRFATEIEAALRSAPGVRNPGDPNVRKQALTNPTPQMETAMQNMALGLAPEHRNMLENIKQLRKYLGQSLFEIHSYSATGPSGAPPTTPTKP